MTTTNTDTNEVPFEHERRFFPNMKTFPVRFWEFPMSFIVQGYLEDPLRTRIRSEFVDGKYRYFQTRKSGEGISRREDEIVLSDIEYEALRVRQVYFLEKSRYFVSTRGIGTFDVNIFHGLLASYVQIEKEFDSHEEALAFIPPPWFGEEVTDDGAHSNYALAKLGIPFTK